MASRKTSLSDDPFITTEKVMQTFRMPRELVSFLRCGADATPGRKR